MQIIEQYYEIQPELTELTTEAYQKQIERRGRICYKSEDRITDESAPVFVDKVINQKHNSVMEMAVIHVKFKISPFDVIPQFNNFLSSPFFKCSYLEDKNIFVVTASIRAWREFRKLFIGFDINVYEFVHYKFPDFFKDRPPLDDSIFCVFNDMVNMFEMEIVSDEWIKANVPNYRKHIHVCVKLVTNRVVTHEIVRHRPCSFLQESQRYVRYDRGEMEFIKPVQWDNWKRNQQKRFIDTCLDAEENYRANVTGPDKMTPQEARNNLPNSTKTEILVYTDLQQWNHIMYQRSEGGADPQMKGLMKPLLEDLRQLYPGYFDCLVPKKG